MKSLLSLSAIFVATLAHAGVDSQLCFVTNEAVPVTVPAQLCFEYFIALGSGKLTVNGGNMEGDYTIIEALSEPGGSARIFARKSVFHKTTADFDSDEAADIVIEGVVDSCSVDVDLTSLKIRVDYTATKDSFRSVDRSRSFFYRRED